MLSPLDIFALWSREKGTRYFLALQNGYPGKRIQALPIELGPENPEQGTLFDETDWAVAKIPPHPINLRGQAMEIKTEYETKPLGRLHAYALTRLPQTTTA